MNVMYKDDTCEIAYRLHKSDDKIFKIDQDALNRTIINRSYYALFHKILPYYPLINNSTGGKKHEALREAIKANRELHQLFCTLQDLRVWADYKIEMPMKISDLTAILEKTYSVIKRNGL